MDEEYPNSSLNIATTFFTTHQETTFLTPWTGLANVRSRKPPEPLRNRAGCGSDRVSSNGDKNTCTLSLHKFEKLNNNTSLESYGTVHATSRTNKRIPLLRLSPSASPVSPLPFSAVHGPTEPSFSPITTLYVRELLLKALPSKGLQGSSAVGQWSWSGTGSRRAVQRNAATTEDLILYLPLLAACSRGQFGTLGGGCRAGIRDCQIGRWAHLPS